MNFKPDCKNKKMMKIDYNKLTKQNTSFNNYANNLYFHNGLQKSTNCNPRRLGFSVPPVKK